MSNSSANYRSKTSFDSSLRFLFSSLIALVFFFSFVGVVRSDPDSSQNTKTIRTDKTGKTGKTDKIDKIIVEKEKRTLSLYSEGNLIKTYKIALGFSPGGHKVKVGDGKTPEGNYTISAKNGHSRFHLALSISYPNKLDLENARKRGVDPGGDIMIHGAPNQLASFTKVPGLNWLFQQFDWSKGCISVTNSDIEEIYKRVPVGTPIIIKP